MMSAAPPISLQSSMTNQSPTKGYGASLKRSLNPFMNDDDSDDSDNEDGDAAAEPRAKRQMLKNFRQPAEDDEAVGLSRIEAQHNELPSESMNPAEPRTTSLFSASTMRLLQPTAYTVSQCNGKAVTLRERKQNAAASYESMVAARSRTKEGRAKKSYYGIDIHKLMDAAKESSPRTTSNVAESAVVAPTTETPTNNGKKTSTLLWTEKYRARRFMDLCGDDGTNRQVLRWLKRWDDTVFPGTKKKATVKRNKTHQGDEEKPLRKILMLTGPPGLGKTTLAHVCARQAGYEVMEVNASDDRSRDVVKNRIRTSLGTESVKSVTNRAGSDTANQQVAKPVCLVVDEVDGVVSGSGASGEGGFVKALMDLVLTDQRNEIGSSKSYQGPRKKRPGDDFRFLRPLILICNDVYHPSLRPLRQSNLAEVIHVGRPTIDGVVGRLKSVFEKEGIPCEKDAVRKLCEAAWGMTSGIDAKRGAESTVQGDLRGVMVVGEWVACRFRSCAPGANPKLTRQWLEQHVLHDLANGAAGARGLGRGSVKDIIGRLFQEGGGFPKQAMDLATSKTKHEQPKTELGFGEQQKKHSMQQLTHMIETSGEISHIVNEIFAEYPRREFNDDCYLTKPNVAYDWLHFHDECQSRLYSSQEWELAPYLSQPVLACHHLFASPKRQFGHAMAYDRRWGKEAAQDEEPPMAFSSTRADYEAHEAEKLNRSVLQAMQCQLSPTMMRSFRSAEDMATDLLPYLVRMVSPNVKPVVVGGSQGSTASVRKDTERVMVRRAAEVLAETGVLLQKGKIESETVSRGPEFVYRMEPDLDALSTFETGSNLLSSQAPTRYAVRQVLDQELQRTIAQRESSARQARFRGGTDGLGMPLQPLPSGDKENRRKQSADSKAASLVKRDFFGRVVQALPLAELDANSQTRAKKEQKKVWVTYHEGLNNAVRKPISLAEFMAAM